MGEGAMEREGNAFGLEYLLELDGEVFLLDAGFWVKFEVRLLKPSVYVPHGIKYSLTLHDQDSKRILGYDNAHSIYASPGRASKKTWDHRHRRRKLEPYEFRSAGELLEDFWKDVELILKSK
jgi:hypothetical protein